MIRASVAKRIFESQTGIKISSAGWYRWIEEGLIASVLIQHIERHSVFVDEGSLRVFCQKIMEGDEVAVVSRKESKR